MKMTSPGPPRTTPDRVVDRLGAARGEDDLARARTEQPGDLLARILHRDARDAALRVQAGGITCVIGEEREHRLERRRAEWRRRRVVEVRAGHEAQTRVTQWASPSGRVASKIGWVSP